MDSNGVPSEDLTDVTSNFVDAENQTPILKEEITRWVTTYICGPPHNSQEQLEIFYVIIWNSSNLDSKFH